MLQSLQAGRAIAALMVLGFHLGLAIQSYFGVSALLLPFGHAGVEFFFVLSGFIIMSAHRADVNQPRQIGRFLLKRFVRIYPSYWIVFLLAWLGAYRIVNLSPEEALRALLLLLLLLPAATAPGHFRGLVPAMGGGLLPAVRCADPASPAGPGSGGRCAGLAAP